MERRENPRTTRAREALMDATLSLVSQREVDGITLTEVAEAAGVSRPTVYKLFNDTTSLVAATAAEFIGKAVAEAERRIDAETDRGYFEALMRGFVEQVYAERDFCRNVMHGPAAGKTASFVIGFLDERMRTREVGKRMAGAGASADDFRAALSAGVVWLLTKWLASDFEGENSPANMAKRLAGTLFELSGV